MKLIHEYSAAELITDRPSGMRILQEGVVRTNKPHQSSGVDISHSASQLSLVPGRKYRVRRQDLRFLSACEYGSSMALYCPATVKSMVAAAEDMAASMSSI